MSKERIDHKIVLIIHFELNNKTLVYDKQTLFHLIWINKHFRQHHTPKNTHMAFLSYKNA
jgi:hypothetical protein